MGLLPADLKREMQSADPSVFVYLEMDWATGTERYAKAGVNSSSAGVCNSTLISCGKLNQNIVPGQTTLSAVTLDVVVSDLASEFSNRLGKGEAVLNVAARVYIASPNAAAPFEVFGGLLISWEMTSPKTWTWHLQSPDVKLATVFPRYQINRFDFVNLDKGATGTWLQNRKTLGPVTLGGYTPIVYGKHDDYADQGQGAIPCPLVDNAAFKNLVSIGIVNVRNVYVDGVLSTTSLYSIVKPLVNGRQYTVIDWTSTHNTNTITADVEGYETVGDGTGYMIADPIGIIEHLVTNFVLNDYQRGNWLPTDATFFDTVSNAQTKALLANRANGAAYASARYISNQISGLQAVQDMCSSMGLLPVWTDAGKLTFKLDNPNPGVYPALYIDSPFIRWEQVKDFGIKFTGKQASRVIVTFENIASGGAGQSNSNTVPKEYYQLEVNDPRSVALADEHLSTPFGPTSYP